MIRQIALAMALLAFALAGVGCESSGGRESCGPDYASTILAMSDAGPHDGERVKVSAPIRVAVAQLGELSPPQWALEQMRKNASAFADVQVVPSKGDESPGSSHRSSTTAPTSGERMRRCALDLGCDYLFVFGSTVDHSVNPTSLSAADLTIIGAYVVPGQQLTASATVAGSLIDATTGRVALTVNADAKAARHSPAAQREADDEALMQRVRDEGIGKLIDRLGERVCERSRVR